MAKGATILVAAEPRGQFRSGKISGAIKPGALMQVKAATAFSGGGGGEPTWEPFAPSGGDGKPGLIAVLLEDNLQGKTITDAYVDGTQCRLYCPIPGEYMNVLVGEGGGTSNNVEDGVLVPNSSGVCVPFQALETKTLFADATLVFCQYTGA